MIEAPCPTAFFCGQRNLERFIELRKTRPRQGYYAFDRTEEAAFWETLAKRYGTHVLALMCATGEMAVELARRGFRVYAVDLIPEMVREGQRRWGDIDTLTFAVGDIRALNLPEKNVDFAFTSDLNHLLTKTDCQMALKSIRDHLRAEGGLGLELSLPGGPSILVWPLARLSTYLVRPILTALENLEKGANCL